MSTKERVLIVEDEEHLARGLAFNLEAEGYRIELAERGEEALVRLFDTGAPPVEGRTLVIENGRIARITAAADAKVPAGTRTIDLSGHTVIPGLVGMHNHTFYTTRGRSVQLQFSAPRLYLGSGLTTIRTTGGTSPYHEINMKRGIDRGQIPGPRMHLTGPYLTGPGGAYTFLAVGPRPPVLLHDRHRRCKPPHDPAPCTPSRIERPHGVLRRLGHAGRVFRDHKRAPGGTFSRRPVRREPHGRDRDRRQRRPRSGPAHLEQ